MNEIVLGAYNSLSDYFELSKPRIGLMVVFTTFAGMYLSNPSLLSPELVLLTLFGTYMASSSSGLLNNYLDRDIDPLMERTAKRATACRRVSESSVLIIGLLLAVLSFLLLAATVNTLTASLALFTIVFYVLVYTGWLKRRSPWCTEIGGVAGAMPPLIGSAAVTGTITLPAALMFLLMFLWQPPHFWALALLRVEEYRRAGIPILPVVAGEEPTRQRMLWYTLTLPVTAVLICYLLNAHWIFYGLSLSLNLYYLYRTVQFCGQPVTRNSAMSLFGFSILYLLLMFLLLFFMV